jgi:membrane protease YdiL (CAAX protease family)
VLVFAADHLLGETRSLGVEVVLQWLFCALGAAVVFVVTRLERLPVDSIGLRRPDWLTVVSGVLLALATLYLLPPLTAPLVEAAGREGLDAGLARLAAWPAWFRVFVGATSGLVEETLYRGYAVERLAWITGRRWLGATIAAIAFALAHVPAWGLGFALAADLPFGIVMTLFYLWRRDLAASAIAHSTGLVVSLLATVP